MRLHFCQHVPFEDPPNIEVWAKEKGYPFTGTLLFRDEGFPEMNAFDWLIILGGPMNIYEEKKYPWLVREKKFIAAAIQEGKIVIGICLGAQLVADVLGGKVTPNPQKEIGWFPVTLTPAARRSSLFAGLPGRFTAFHWHGDTFAIPSGAVRVAESEGCRNQAFVYRERVIGLQFHLESSRESIQKLVQNCQDEIIEGKYIQKTQAMLSGKKFLLETKKSLWLFLDSLDKELEMIHKY
jgi:GMP synthase-like glutamine amidotransferase